MSDWLFAACALVAAGLVQGLSGFGSGLVSMSLLPLIWPVSFSVAISAVYSLFISCTLAWQLRAHLRLRDILIPIAAALCCVPIGARLLASVDSTVAMGGLGVLLTVYSVWNLVRPKRPTTHMSRRWGAGAGVASGLLTGALNTGGPPIVAWIGAQPWTKDEMKGTLQVFFIPSSVVAITTYAFSGVVSSDTLRWNLQLAPALAGGLWLGTKLYSRVPQEGFRRVLLIGLLIVGVRYVAGAWLKL
ncbi:MAG: sulfite exporter TauE/SafE family protein [Myxococcota bacterium]